MSSQAHGTHRGLAASLPPVVPWLLPVWLGVLLTLLVATAPAALADDRGTLIQVRAERLANAGECADAVALLSAAPEPARSSAELLRLKGKCQIDLARYRAAIDSLTAAKSADAQLANLDLMLGIARYHDEDFEGASLALGAARIGNTERQAELELYSGLVLLRDGNSREAALALERARRLDADAVEPVASYYAALAWHSERETDRAQAALERTRQHDPDGPWAKQASDALRSAGGDVPWWLVVTAGVEYDSNAILRAKGDTQRDADDFRAVWSVSGGERLLESENWSGGIIGSYSGSAHFDFADFDLQYPSVGAWLDRRLGTDTLLRFRYDFGYAWIDYDPFVETHVGRVSLVHDWGAVGTTDLFVEGQHSDFKYTLEDWPDIVGCGALIPPATTPCGPNGLNEARYRNGDGSSIRAGIEQRVPVAVANSTLRAGYGYRRYWAQGDEWDYDGHRIHVGVSSLLPFDFLLDLEGSYMYVPFRHPSSYPKTPVAVATLGTYVAADREDNIWVGAASLEKSISDDVSVSARYTYTESNSNSEFFDYHRHVVGAYVTVRLP